MFRTDLLKSKRILITGGGTGLGKGMAHRFLELGATVYICGRREDVLKQTAAELSAATQGLIHALPCDVRNLDAVEAMIDSRSGPQVHSTSSSTTLPETSSPAPKSFPRAHSNP
jgi:NADP-dependent 3-hydroxy acid dehydrogenase YdfG